MEFNLSKILNYRRSNREYNTSLSMETSFIRFKNPKNLKRMLNV